MEMPMPFYQVEYQYDKSDIEQMEKWAGTLRLPEPIKMLGGYSYAGSHSGFVIVSCPDHAELTELMKPYRHVIDFTIRPLKPLK
jgi:hypothetical protein